MCGNSFLVTLTPPTINGTETIPHSDTVSILDLLLNTGLSFFT